MCKLEGYKCSLSLRSKGATQKTQEHYPICSSFINQNWAIFVSFDVQTEELQIFFEALEINELYATSLYSRGKDATIVILSYKS